MRKHFRKPALFAALCIFVLTLQTYISAQTRETDFPQISTYKTSSSGFLPNIFGRFQEKAVPRLVLENSTRIESLIHDGNLDLSLSDALALALENNLDVAVQRYIP